MLGPIDVGTPGLDDLDVATDPISDLRGTRLGVWTEMAKRTKSPISRKPKQPSNKPEITLTYGDTPWTEAEEAGIQSMLMMIYEEARAKLRKTQQSDQK